MIYTSSFEDAIIPEESFVSFVLKNVQNYPDRAALIDGPSGRTITYGQLAAGIDRVAASLHQRGFGKGDVFAIYSPNVPEYALAFYGVARAGGTVTTANPLYTAGELAKQLSDSAAKYLLTVPTFLENAQQAMAESNVEELFVFGEVDGATPFASLLQSSGPPPDVEINPKEDLIVLPYSSGTTGLPKGVMLTHHNLVANICQMDGLVDLGGDDNAIGVLPFYHIYGMVVIMGLGLYQGGTIVTMPRFEFGEFLKIMQDYEISIAALVPPILVGLAKHPLVEQYDLSSLRAITSGAAPLSGELQTEVSQRLACSTLQGYGLTEASPVTHVTINEPGKIRVGSVGNGVRNTETRIVDPVTGVDQPPNEQGEIWVRGPQVMKGYLNNPEATAATITSDGWLKTGDLGHMDDDGYLYVVDRLKELIKYKGNQVAPAELEGILLTHEAIADVAVIPVADEEAGEIPKAFVQLKPEEDTSATAIMDFVAGQVAPYKKVREVEFVESIPKSLSGKILRRVLVEQERAKRQN